MLIAELAACEAEHHTHHIIHIPLRLDLFCTFEPQSETEITHQTILKQISKTSKNSKGSQH